MFDLMIATPEEKIFEGQVHSAKAPGEEGSFQILSHHASLVASLRKGDLIVEDHDHQKVTYKISGGFLEVAHNKVSVLADSIEK